MAVAAQVTKQRPDHYMRLRKALTKLLPEHDGYLYGRGGRSAPSTAEGIAYRTVNGDNDLERELLGIRTETAEERQESVTALCRRHCVEPEFLLRVIRATAVRKAWDGWNEKQLSKKLLQTAKSLKGMEPRELDSNRMHELRDIAIDGLTTSVMIYFSTDHSVVRDILMSGPSYQIPEKEMEELDRRIPEAGENATRFASQMYNTHGGMIIEELGTHTMRLVEFAIANAGTSDAILEFGTYNAPKIIEVTEADIVRNGKNARLTNPKLLEITRAHMYEIVHGLGSRALRDMFSGLTERIDRTAREIAIELKLYKPEAQAPVQTEHGEK